MIKRLSGILLLVVFCLNVNSGYGGHTVLRRCFEDRLSSLEEIQGRNAWAEKCGYIARDERDELDRRAFYVVFREGSKGGHPNVPVSRRHHCRADLTVYGTCQMFHDDFDVED